MPDEFLIFLFCLVPVAFIIVVTLLGFRFAKRLEAKVFGVSSDEQMSQELDRRA